MAKNKTVFIIFLFTLLVSGVSAQSVAIEDTISNKFSYMAGALVEVSSLNSSAVTSFGLGGGLVVDNSFYLGVYGMGLPKTNVLCDNNIYEKRASFKHGGLWIGYLFNVDKPLHYGLDLKLGAGKINYEYSAENLPSIVFDDNVFVMMPAVSVGLDVTTFFRLNFNIGYRFLSGSEEVSKVFGDTIEKDFFSSPFGTISLVFGNFK